MAKLTKQSRNRINKKVSRASARRRSNWLTRSWYTRARKTIFLPFILLFAVVGVYLLFFTKAATEFVLVGTHPYASTQTTVSGKILTGLQEYNGKLYMGYGDTYANTGPVRIVSYNPATNSFSTEWTADTEAVWTYRPLNNRLFAPSDDPRSSADFAAGLPWSNSGAIHMTHNFDMAQLGTSIFAVGSQGYNAYVFRSNDGGVTWSSSFNEPPAISGDIGRYYFAAVFNSKLYVQGYGYYSDKPHPNSRVFNGTSWSTGPNMLPLGGHGWHPRVFGTKLIYQTHLPNNMLNKSGNDRSRFMVFDGTTATSPLGSQIWDFAISEGYVYVLGVDGNILRSSDLQTWTSLGSAPANSRAIGFLGTTMYVATTDSKLYRLNSYTTSLPPPPPPTTTDTIPPLVNVTAPAANSTVSGNINFNASASDSEGVTKLEVYVDGKLLGTSTTNTIYQRWNTRKATSGSHVLMAKAYDAAGNIGTTSITVYK